MYLKHHQQTSSFVQTLMVLGLKGLNIRGRVYFEAKVTPGCQPADAFLRVTSVPHSHVVHRSDSFYPRMHRSYMSRTNCANTRIAAHMTRKALEARAQRFIRTALGDDRD